MDRAIFGPVCAQVLLTFVVWVWMGSTRIGTLRRKRVNPQRIVDPAQHDELLKSVVNPSDNFENLFEMPVLFYVGALAIFVTNQVDSVYLTLAWIFVAFRVLHTLVHCIYNRIMHRAVVYWISSFALWALWLRFALQLLR